MKLAGLGRCHAPENPMGDALAFFHNAAATVRVADPIHCSEPHTPRAKIVTDRTLPKCGLLSVSEMRREFSVRARTESSTPT
jgi:hypothetical protein